MVLIKRLKKIILSVSIDMELLISITEFEQAGSRDLIPYKCSHCGSTATRAKNVIQARMKKGKGTPMYCCRSCLGSRGRVNKVFNCAQCGTIIIKTDSEIKTGKKRGHKHHFCSQKCSGVFAAAHKTKGNRRSKLEKWIEEQMKILYPMLDIRFNSTEAIKAELDIYIPSLKLAFELNGIFHYEPIFGTEKLQQTQSKDRYKLHACTEAGIDLCIIDTSTARYFKPKASQRYLEIITKIINERMAG